MTAASGVEYKYDSPELNDSHQYLLPAVRRLVEEIGPKSIFDLGCGNGSVANALANLADIRGVDVSPSAIAEGRRAYPNLDLAERSVYDDLASEYGQFPLVISLEVVEHLYDPRAYVRSLYNLIAPGGYAIVSTPYHGYLKNLALAVTGKLDAHFTALWDGGHIKFWSIRTLGCLLGEAGFQEIRFQRVGRLPPLAKSMIAVARRAA